MAEHDTGILEMLKRQGMDLEAVIKQSQGGAVIILTQLLANSLEHSLIRVMQPFNSETRKAIFGGMGPLSGFSAKIHIAYGIGLLSKELCDDAHTLRRIRNAFAHAEERLSLDSEKIAKLMSKLSTSRSGAKPKDVISQAVENITRHLAIAVHDRTKDQTPRDKADFVVGD